LIYNITDKGISVGQQSTATIQNCIIVNCNLGLGLKDSCKVNVNHCTFYGTGTPIACFEKNAGSAGGNAWVKNCIMSNSYDNSFRVDERSTWKVSYSQADNDLLPGAEGNLFTNPGFVNPSAFDFSFLPSSPCLAGGYDNEAPAPMGSFYHTIIGEPQPALSYIYCNAEGNPDRSEFIGITNPSSLPVDLSRYKITMGIDYEFTETLLIDPGETIFLANSLLITSPDSYPGIAIQWTSGNLANEGEALRLVDKYGIVIDQVVFSPEHPWPDYSSTGGAVLELISTDLDNHFAESWRIIDYQSIVSVPDDTIVNNFSVYPNPTTGLVYLEAAELSNQTVYVHSIAGKLVLSKQTDINGIALLDLTACETGVYFVKAGKNVSKLVLLK
jgi:hypothetical protein